MKVYPYIVKARQRADSMYPIYIVVSRRQGRITINSGLASSVVFEGNIFPRGEKNSRVKTSVLTKMLEDIEELALANTQVGNRELKKMMENRVLMKKNSDTTLVHYLLEYAGRSKTYRTRIIYESTAKVLSKYDSDAGLNIDYKWLENFEAYLLEMYAVNGIAIHMRNIRAVINWAIDNGLTTNYPFRKFKVKTEQTRKRNLSASDLKKVITISTTKKNVRYRDFFALSFYLIGINPKDLLEAKPEQVVNGRLEYKRAKTGKLYSVKIEPEAQELIDKYKGVHHLLKFADTSSYTRFMQYANFFYRRTIPGLTQYWARHSWATIAAELDISIDTISEALGHSHGVAVTNVYVDFNQKKVDEANRRVIDFVLNS